MIARRAVVVRLCGHLARDSTWRVVSPLVGRSVIAPCDVTGRARGRHDRPNATGTVRRGTHPHARAGGQRLVRRSEPVVGLSYTGRAPADRHAIRLRHFGFAAAAGDVDTAVHARDGGVL